MLADVLPYLACPHCGAGLSAAGRAVRCASGHGFDVARQGYVSLLAGRAPVSGDTAEMVAARAEFLDAGHYAPITRAVVRGGGQGGGRGRRLRRGPRRGHRPLPRRGARRGPVPGRPGAGDLEAGAAPGGPRAPAAGRRRLRRVGHAAGAGGRGLGGAQRVRAAQPGRDRPDPGAGRDPRGGGADRRSPGRAGRRAGPADRGAGQGAARRRGAGAGVPAVHSGHM